MKRNTKTKQLFSAVISLTLVFLLAVASFANAFGDINNDGDVTAADARLALRAAVGLETLNEVQKAAADVDEDGKVSAADARLLLRAAVGLEKLAPKCVTHIFETYTQVKDSKGKDTGKHTSKCVNCGYTVTEACTVSAWTQIKTDRGVATANHGRSCTKCGGMQETEACSYGEKLWTNEYRERTCTHGYSYIETCSVCSGKKIYALPELGHDLEKDKSVYLAPTAITEGYQGYKCTREDCGYTEVRYIQPTDGIGGAVTFFNDAVNSLKDGTHSYSGFSMSKTRTDVSKDTSKTFIKYSTGMKLLAAAMGDEFSEKNMLAGITEGLGGDSDVTTIISSIQTPINNNNFFLKGQDVVIRLNLDDVSSYQKLKINGLDFLEGTDFGSTITVTSSSGYTYPYSISRYKEANIGEVYKITFDLKTETLADLNKTDEPGILQRIADKDLRLLAQMNLDNMMDTDDGAMKADMDCKCESASGGAKVTYYFDVETAQPIAAVYALSYNIHENVKFSFSFDGDSEEIPLKGELMNGAVDFTSSTSDNYYFFFDNYFDAN